VEGRSDRVDQQEPGQASDIKPLIIGAGPAGLTAAYELTEHNITPIVLEMADQVGGIARTDVYKGFRFDIGGHRFFTKVDEVNRLWQTVLGDDLIKVPRMSRIYFRGKYFDYPLRPWNALRNLGIYESVRVLLSYLKWQVWPHEEEDNFEHWVVNRFGGRLYWFFFRTYTEKVWGMDPKNIRSDWAEQRIRNLSLSRAIFNALTGYNDTTSLIDKFQYPRLGPGMMWERFRDKVEERGGEVRLQSGVIGLRRDGERISHVVVEDRDGQYELTPTHVVSSMPLPWLIFQIEPKAPTSVLDAAGSLKHRDFLIVTLILDQPDPFPDNWIYVHAPDVNVGRIQNFKSWSEAMVPDLTKSSLGMEYFCNENDELWAMDDEGLIELATAELEVLGLASKEDVIDGTVIRQPKAYPVYDQEYQKNVDIIRDYLAEIENLHTVGRNGMHRYNNQDHSMLTALLAARNILGEHHDLWNVNVERSYHEEFMKKEPPSLDALRSTDSEMMKQIREAYYEGPERRTGTDRRSRSPNTWAGRRRSKDRRRGRDRRTAVTPPE